MEEDVLGTRESAIGDRYTTCTRCGQPIPRDRAHLVDDDRPEATRSEQAELCDDCRRHEIGEEAAA
jgi:hypothetical protein